jgi:hypothetical protein
MNEKDTVNQNILLLFSEWFLNSNWPQDSARFVKGQPTQRKY